MNNNRITERRVLLAELISFMDRFGVEEVEQYIKDSYQMITQIETDMKNRGNEAALKHWKSELEKIKLLPIVNPERIVKETAIKDMTKKLEE